MTLTLENTIHHFVSHPQTRVASQEMAKMIFEAFQKSDPESRRETLYFLRQKLHAYPSSPLCQALESLSSSKNWKETLLGIHVEEIVKVKAPFFVYSNSIDKPVEFKFRFSQQVTVTAGGIFGSTFITNKAHRLDTAGHHILDGAYGVHCYDEKGIFSGFALALGDGAGGHFGDSLQDTHIGRASYFAAKWATRFLSAYHRPEKLLAELPTLIASLKQEVTLKGNGEGSTLVTCRIFAEQEGFRLIGFNIGDSLLFAWDPQTQTPYPLLPARVSEAGTAIFPQAYRSFEIDRVDQFLPKDTLVFLLSDGVHDLLPYVEEERVYPNGLNYRIRTLKDLSSLFVHLPFQGDISLYFQALIGKALQKIESLRLEKQGDSEIQLGDDATLIGCRLAQPITTFGLLMQKIQQLFS